MNDFRYSRSFGFPPVVKNLIIINVLVFVAQVTFGEGSYTLDNWFALHDVHSVYFKPHQLLTYMFMHGSVEHLLFNMLALWMFGGVQLENHWGSKRFLTYYLLCGIGAGVLHLVVLYIQIEPLMQVFRTLPTEQQLELIDSPRFIPNGITVGASGSIYGVLAAYGYLFPNNIILANFFLPMKVKWFVFILAAGEFLAGIRNSTGDNVAHFAHLGGALTGLIIVFIWNKTNRKTFY